MSVVFLDAEFDAFVNDISGPIANELERVATVAVLPDAWALLDRPWAGWGDLNPPPGPPRKRTGDLQDSLEVIPAVVALNLTGDLGVAVYVAADPEHNGFKYALHLREQGYKWLPDFYYDE
jgi:hypothetical protein